VSISLTFENFEQARKAESGDHSSRAPGACVPVGRKRSKDVWGGASGRAASFQMAPAPFCRPLVSPTGRLRAIRVCHAREELEVLVGASDRPRYSLLLNRDGMKGGSRLVD
jgi:hypothetical protein